MHANTGVFWLVLCTGSWLHAQPNILTANGSNDRTNANLQEIQLSPATVNAATFGKVGEFPVDGQVYAQPLYVSGLSIGGGLHNVLFVATMHNSIYAFDADSMKVLWQMNLGPSIPSRLLFNYGDIGVEIGILGTPTIDLGRGVIYAVSDNLQNGAPVFYLHALDLTTGSEVLGGPIRIGGAVQGSGAEASADGTVPFDPAQHIQRPGLLLANNAIYVAFGSHEDSPPYHGWLMSYDASNIAQQLGVYMSTPNGDGGAFWQSGRGPAADDVGSVYAITGNGDYDNIQNFGQSFLKLSGASPARIGSFTMANWKSFSDADVDIAAGPALIPGTHTVLGADKDGNLYVLDGDAMENSASASPSAFQVFTASGDSVFNFAVWGRPGSTNIYIQGHGEPVKCFQITPAGFNSVPGSVGSQIDPYERIGMTLSANGAIDGTGILWETTGNYNNIDLSGTLHAYDASNLASELWNSGMNPGDTMGPIVKFAEPTVANGRVYVPTLAGRIMVYGLFNSPVEAPGQPSIDSVMDAAAYSPVAVSPGEVVAIFGSNLGPTSPAGMQLDPSGNVATSLSNTEVLFDGTPAPMVWASATQVNAVVPFGVQAPATQVQVQYQNQVSGTFSMPVAPAAPGIFSADGTGNGQGAILNQDGTVNSGDRPAPAGSVVALFATGAGRFSPPGIDGSVVSPDNLPVPVLPVSVQIGGAEAAVLYAGGAPGLVEGVLQVNVQVPGGTPAGDVPILLRIGDRTSQPGLTIAVQSQAAPE